MAEENLKLLDCTLRDGGYYNAWDFDPNLVTNYLAAMANSGIQYIELGLRQFDNESFLGAHAFTTREYLEHLSLPDGPIYGVMIDARTILSRVSSHDESIDRLFLDSNKEEISFVRIAAHFSEVPDCLPMISRLKEKGYLVGLNIMQISLYSVEEIEKLASLVQSWESVDVLYFADSLGAMDAQDLERVFRALRKNWLGEIGLHAHNNMGQGISNIKLAIDLGCTWVDSTVTGMGRGAGNAQTEFLLLEIEKLGYKHDYTSIFDLANDFFEPIKKDCGWGASLPYYIGALNSVHPTFVQKIMADSTIESSAIPKLLEDLGKTENPSKYDNDVLDYVKSKIIPSLKKVQGDHVPAFLKGRDVLLVAQTDSSIKYKNAISDYVEKNKPILMSINHPKEEINLNYDYIFISHNEKFRVDESRYKNNNLSYIAPKELFLDEDIKIAHNYGISVETDIFETNGNFATIPFRLTLAYAISFCIDANVDNIYLAGFSGFDQEDPRQRQMQRFLAILARENIELISLTPTSFPLQEKSIYAI